MKNLLLLILATFTFQILVANDTLVDPETQIKMIAQAYCDDDLDEVNKLANDLELVLEEMSDDAREQFEDSIKTMYMSALMACLPESFEPDLVEYTQNRIREAARAYYEDDEATYQLIEQQIDSISQTMSDTKKQKFLEYTALLIVWEILSICCSIS
jgi:ElaB/YqjD/DUF883 family membrane-anchored ribosome-binding protein